MRVFIAIDIGDKIRRALSDLQQQLQRKVDIKKNDVRWVNPESIHLTLKFLGEVKDAKLAEVCNIVKEVVSRHKSFELDIESLGCFGGKAVRVLWVGAGEENENLLGLQKDVEQQLALADWPKEARKFAGHLTLCRIKNSAAGVKLAQVSKDYKDFRLGSLVADSVSVYQSRLTPQGPVYTVIGNYKLS